MDSSKFIVYLPNIKHNIQSSADLREFIFQNSLKCLSILHFIPFDRIKSVNIKFPE